MTESSSSSAVLPWLPDAWLTGIAAGEYIERARGDVKGTKGAFAWIKKRPDAKGEPCKLMAADVDKAVAELTESAGGGAHDTLVRTLFRVVGNGAEGHKGCHTAVVAIGRAFVTEVAGRRRSAGLEGEAAGTTRTREEARREVGRAVVGAVRLMLGNLNQPWMVEAGLSEGAASCSCWDAPEGDPPAAKDPAEYELGEVGYAEHLLDVTDGNLLWVPGDEAWYGWDEERFVWAKHSANYGMQQARLLAPRVKMAMEQVYESLAGLDDNDSEADRRKAQLKRLFEAHKQLNQHGTLVRTLEQLKTWPECVVDSDRMDANERVLMCPDGKMIELTDEGFHVREGLREDYVTVTTGTPFVKEAKDPLWESYLDTFLPDKSLRRYVQCLLGYSLLGSNPRRLLAFFQGPTSTGKSTILEAASAALGGYSGSIDVSVFRQKQDATPRPDLLRVMKLRLGYTSEAGAAQHLHADHVKRITGGDSISARALFSNAYVDRVPAFTPIIATNEAPHIEAADMALWKRMWAVPFDVQVREGADDQAARDRLRASGSARAAVLWWLLQGWDGYVKGGLDDVPRSVMARTKQMRAEVSDFHAWFYETLEVVPGDKSAFVASGFLYETYKNAMLADGVKDVKTAQQFGRMINGLGVMPPTTKPLLREVKGKRVKVRYGVRFRRPGTP